MKDFFKKYGLYVALVFGIGVVGAVVYGVLKPDEEGGLLTGCWQNNRFIFGDTGDNGCDIVQELKWERSALPLRVAMAARTAEAQDEAEFEVQEAVDQVNRDLGFKLVRTVPHDAKHDITVAWHGTLAHSKHSGTCGIYRELDDADGNFGLRMRGTIIIGGAASGAYGRTIYHELGHCAGGLEHDHYPGSAMYKQTTTFDEVPFFGFSDHDVKLLRDLYR